MKLTDEQIDQWEQWFRDLSADAKAYRPPGFYELCRMARQDIGRTAPEAGEKTRDAEFMSWMRRHAPTQLAELITRREQMRSQDGNNHS